MSTAAPPRPGTLPGMGKKKPTGGKHTTQRINVGVPEPWHSVLRKLAAKRQQPVLYTLIALLKAEAEEQGIDELPPAPWDEEAKDE